MKNVLPMCEAVHKLWFANAFSVDVEVSIFILCLVYSTDELALF